MNPKEKIKLLLEEQSKGRNAGLTLADLPRPDRIPGMKAAAERIVERLQLGDRLLVVGDYDADGIMATTILIDFFRKTQFSEQVDYIVPDRFVDGYGVSKNMVNYAINNNFHFIVTVDNGIGAKEAVTYATENRIEVIITDHHTPGNAVPEVDIIVDLKYNQGDFPYVEISGATISWYLCCQIQKELQLPIDMRQYLDLVAITVVSDVMPLEDINLVFFKHGLHQIKSRSRKVYEFVFNEFSNTTLNETDIGFKLVPMINAVGRIDHAKHGVELFLSKSVTEIKKGVAYLNEVNNKRKILTDQLLTLVMPEAIRQYESGQKAIIVRNEELHEGIVGIIAGKLAEKFKRPSYVFGWNRAKQCWKGSGRTAGSVQLYDLSLSGAQHALGFGGHAGAVGVAIPKNNFDLWTKAIQEVASDFSEAIFYTTTNTEILIDLSYIDSELIELLDSHRPFGQGFQTPIFKTNAWIDVKESYKEGIHWKTEVMNDSGITFTTWFFHEKGIGSCHRQKIDFKFIPQKTFSNRGFEIELHGTLPFSGE